jgi:hypothetical protein
VDDDLKARLREFGADKGLARLGDSFVNLVFSAAKTKTQGKPAGEKVPDRVLSESLRIADLPIPARLDHGERGDVVEAVLGYAWIHEMLTLEEAVEMVRQTMVLQDFQSRALERSLSARAFSKLLKVALGRIVEADGDAEARA